MAQRARQISGRHRRCSTHSGHRQHHYVEPLRRPARGLSPGRRSRYRSPALGTRSDLRAVRLRPPQALPLRLRPSPPSSAEKALFVPAPIATTGASRQPRATSRWVPSPPLTTITPTSWSRIVAAARAVVIARAFGVDVEQLDVHCEPADRPFGEPLVIESNNHSLRATFNRSQHESTNVGYTTGVARRRGMRDKTTDVLACSRIRDDANRGRHGAQR